MTKKRGRRRRRIRKDRHLLPTAERSSPPPSSFSSSLSLALVSSVLGRTRRAPLTATTGVECTGSVVGVSRRLQGGRGRQPELDRKKPPRSQRALPLQSLQIEEPNVVQTAQRRQRGGRAIEKEPVDEEEPGEEENMERGERKKKLKRKERIATTSTERVRERERESLFQDRAS